MLTIGEQLIAEGRAKGEAKAKTEVLMALLQHKFSSVSDEVQAPGGPSELR